MKKILFALLASTSIASAADLPLVKAVGYPAAGVRGCYVGLGAAAEVSKASINGVAAGASLYDAGAAVDLAVGCQFSLGGTWAAIEADATYTNMGATQVCVVANCTIGSTWGFSQGVLVGFPWTNIMGYLPNLGAIFTGGTTVPLPLGVVATSSRPYVGGWIHEDDVSAAFGLAQARAWEIKPSIGLGAIHNISCDTCLAKNLVLDTRVEYAFNNSSFAFGPGVTATQGSAVWTKAIFKY